MSLSIDAKLNMISMLNLGVANGGRSGRVLFMEQVMDALANQPTPHFSIDFIEPEPIDCRT